MQELPEAAFSPQDHWYRRILRPVLFGLGSFEFLLAGLGLLEFRADPRHAVFLGLSIFRLSAVLLALLLSVILFLLAVPKLRRRLPFDPEKWIAAHPVVWTFAALAGALAGLITLIAPAVIFGGFAGYLERLRLLGCVAAFQPLHWLFLRLPADRPSVDRSLPRYWLAGLAVGLSLAGFIMITKLGISPDTHHWNVAGIPLTSLQFLAILLAAMGVAGGIHLVRRFLKPDKEAAFDLFLAAALLVGAAFLWGEAPMVKHFFSIRPQPPFNQPFPFSDARVHDLGALSIVEGWGINFGEYTDKPLYMAFLAALHLAAGQDYALMARLQVWVLAFIPACLYLFGVRFHSRYFGVTLALIVLLRQYNAILLSHQVASVNPRLLMTEGLVLLGLVLITWMVFMWQYHGTSRPWISLAAGGVLGLFALIRTNPVMLLPVIPVFILPGFWKDKRAWTRQTVSFFLGFLILLTPWILTGRDATGQPYFFVKFFDIFYTRYVPAGLELPVHPQAGLYPVASHGRAKAGIATGIAGASAHPIGILTFPGFVVNHFLHNMVVSYLALPDSLAPGDQELQSLIQRPYWQETVRWEGELAPAQIPGLLLNLGLIAAGTAWSWKQWRWMGFTPWMVFLVYDLTLGLARNSGSRYLVPIDWIVFFYFSLGVVFLLSRISTGLNQILGMDTVNPYKPADHPGRRNDKKPWILIGAGLALFACLVPVADNWRPARDRLCSLDAGTGLPDQPDGETHGMTLVPGQVLYPSREVEGLSFILLACRRAIPVQVNLQDGKIRSGDLVLVGWASEDLTAPAIFVSGLNEVDHQP